MPFSNLNSLSVELHVRTTKHQCDSRTQHTPTAYQFPFRTCSTGISNTRTLIRTLVSVELQRSYNPLMYLLCSNNDLKKPITDNFSDSANWRASLKERFCIWKLVCKFDTFIRPNRSSCENDRTCDSGAAL